MSGGGSFSTRVAAFFIRSHLTPLLIVVSIALGLFATVTTAKEEEPSITIAMFDVAIAWPGHDTADVDERLARPVAAWVRELPGAEHVLSASADDATLLAVQFRQGVRREDAFTQLSERLNARSALLPEGASVVSLTPRGVEDVPVLAFSITSDASSPEELRRHAVAVSRALEQQSNVSSVAVLGGAQRAFRVEVDPARLASYRLDVDAVNGAIRHANLELPVGRFESGTHVALVRAGSTLGSVHDLEGLPLTETSAGVVRLRDVASVRDVVREPTAYVAHGGRDRAHARVSDSVTIMVSKVTGANSAELTQRLRAWMSTEGARLLPEDANVHVALDTGATAEERVTTLFEHIGIATVVVVVLIGLSLGRREAAIVAIVIPATLAIVPFVYQAAGFTLNRITLAAMIFAIGILVDDAIVVVENVHRRFQEDGGRSVDLRSLAAEAVGEVANPTILATFTVVAALTPTAFVSGMIGQYLRPLPIGASVAMVFSLVIALTVTPYLSYRILRRTHADHAAIPAWLRLYRRLLAWALARPLRGAGVLLAGVSLLLGALALLPTRTVLVKLLPGSDAADMSVVIDLPAGTSLSRAHQEQKLLATKLLEIPEVESLQVYSGRSGPLTFQGVARHYMLRAEPHQGEIQLQIAPREKRSRDSLAIAEEVRRVADAHLSPAGAIFTVAEPPPGPPVQAALVAEIYGASEETRSETAARVHAAFLAEPSLVDVDWTLRPSTPQTVLRTDTTSLSLHAVMGARLVASQRALFAGDALTELDLPGEAERVAVVVQATDAARTQPNDMLDVRAVSMRGALVPVADVARLAPREGRPPLLRKDLLPVVFVMGEMRGAEAPAYAALDITQALRREGVDVDVQWVERAPDAARATLRWAGEWTTTYELFRDLGVALAAALAVIYVMLAAWYGSYVTPIVVMIPIPLALVGVVPAHLLAGVPLSGMAVLGLIALAGTMVRNSILLVDFSQENRGAGHSVVDSIVLASQARARPILLTAGTIIFGDGILFFDPLLQGLGLTMASGALVSTLLTLAIVPIAYGILATWTSVAPRAR